MQKKLFIIFVVVGLSIIPAAIFLYKITLIKPSLTDTLSPTLTPEKNTTVTLDNLVICKGFQKVESEISCEEAIQIATEKQPGRVKSIAPGTLLQKDSPDSKVVEMWRIDILLENPFKKDQEIFEGTRIFIDRKTGSEIRSVYLHKP